MSTVAAISFHDDHTMSIDVAGVSFISMSTPIQVEDGSWVSELLIRTRRGTVALQLNADDSAALSAVMEGAV